MARSASPRFGIATAPSQVDYRDILQVWHEADTIPEIEHAWLYDHLMPIFGDLDGPTYEGWTLLSALATETERLRVGLLVTNNRFRPPAMLAKIAATVDAVSAGRLEFGIGAGSRPSVSFARREYQHMACPTTTPPTRWAASQRRAPLSGELWTEDEPFDFDAAYHQLTAGWCNPKPLQRPHPPILIGGRSLGTLRVVAEHAEVWDMPGGDLDDAVRRSALSTASALRSAATPLRSRARSPAGVLRAARRRPGRDPPGDRRRLRPHRLEPLPSVPGRRRPLGRRRVHQPGGPVRVRAEASPSHTTRPTRPGRR